MALTPSRVIIAEDATGTAFKSFVDTSANHAQAVALVDADWNHMGVPGKPMLVTTTAYLSRGILEGQVYSVQDSIIVPNNGVRNYSIVVPASTTRIFFRYAFELQNAFVVSFFEDTVFSNTGTPLPARNHNRNVTTPSIVTTGFDAVATSDGTRLAYVLFDAAGTTQSGELPKGDWILKSPGKYMIRFDNDSNVGTVRILLWWLEIPSIA